MSIKTIDESCFVINYSDNITERIIKSYTLVCDSCGKEITDFESFQDAVDYKKQNNWKSIKQITNWLDLCSECKGEI